MNKLCIVLTAFASAANASVFNAVAGVEALDAIDTREYVSKVYYAGEKNPRFELAARLRPRADEARIRSEYPDAWQMFARGEIEDFSYFGFRLRQMESGAISREAFFRELQEYLDKNFK